MFDLISEGFSNCLAIDDFSKKLLPDTNNYIQIKYKAASIIENKQNKLRRRKRIPCYPVCGFINNIYILIVSLSYMQYQLIYLYI